MNRENPFSPTFPVNPKYFVNRTDVIDSLKRAFGRSIKSEFPTPDNVAILGDWGVGKTSMLRKFEEIALREFKSRKVVSAIVELIPTSCNSFFLFMKKVVDDIERSFAVKAPIMVKLRERIREWRVKSIGVGTALELERKIRERSEVTVFEDALIHFWKAVESLGIDTVILMLDDLHYLAEGYPQGLYDLRGIFQGLPRHGCNFMLCMSGSRDLFAEVRELAEPFARFFNVKHTLDNFSPEETRNAILTPIERAGLNITVEERVVQKIYDLTVGHPFFIHFLMRELVTIREKGKISIGFFDNHYPIVERIMAREKFAGDFSIASDKEKEILLAVAAIKSDTFTPSQLKIKNVRPRFNGMVRKNLIVKVGRGEYGLYHPLFKEYLRNVENT